MARELGRELGAKASLRGDMQQRICKITSTMLGFEDHGLLTAMIHVDYGGSGQGVGGFALSQTGLHHKRPLLPMPLAMDFIVGVLRACGVDTWERVAGRTIYALFADGAGWNAPPLGIENLPTEPGERFLFAEWQTRVAAMLKVDMHLYGDLKST